MRFLILAAALAAGGCMEHSDHPLKRPNPSKPKVDVLAFSAPWCIPCRKHAPHLRELQDKGLDVTKINVDLHPLKADQYKIKSVPTYVVRHNKVEVWRTHDVHELDKLVK